MFRHLCPIAALAFPFMVPLPAAAQVCSPLVVTAPAAPLREELPGHIESIVYHTDETGPSLFAVGRMYFPHIEGLIDEQWSFARYQRGGWTPLAAAAPSTSLIVADLPAHSPPGPRLYLLNGDALRWWNGATFTLTSARGILAVKHSDQEGPAIALFDAISPPRVTLWRGAGQPIVVNPSASPWNGSIYVLRSVHDGGVFPTLYAVGNFVSTDGTIRGAARLSNGQWQPAPLPPMPAGNFPTDIAAFTGAGGPGTPELHVTWQGGPPSQATVARLRSGEWQTLGDPLSTFPSALSRLSVVREHGVDRLYHLSAPTVARWTGAAWEQPLHLVNQHGQSPWGGASAAVAADLGDGERTYIAGSFRHVQVTPLDAAENRATPVPNIVELGGAMVRGLSAGLSFQGSPHPILTCVYTAQGPRLVASNFTTAGGIFADHMAMFHADRWTNIGSTRRSVDRVYSVCMAVLNGDTRMVRVSTQGAAYRADDGNWVDMPTPQGNFVFELNGSLYAIGASIQRFENASWVTVATGPASLGLWTDHHRFTRSALGSTVHFASDRSVFEFDGEGIIELPLLPSAPTSLVMHDEGAGPTLYAGSPAFPSRVVRLGPSGWEELPAGLLALNGIPVRMASFDDGRGSALFVTGAFRANFTNSPIARFRANAWTAMTVNVPQSAQTLSRVSLAVVEDRLYIAGDFGYIGASRADNFAWIQACPRTCTPDFDGDGTPDTDADIEAFFLCLAGTCCPRCTADFNNDGDSATDADIESFFRVLAGGNC